MKLPSYNQTKHLALVVLIGAIIFTIVEIGLTAGQARRRLAASAAYDESLKAMIDSGASAIAHVEQGAAHLEGVAAEAEARLPQLFDDVHLASRSAAGEMLALRNTTAQLSTTSKQIGDAVAALVSHSDATINEQLAPEIANAVKATTLLLSKYGLTADEATAAIRLASEKSGKTIEELTKQIADPRWALAADNLVAASGEMKSALADIHKDLHDTLKQMPSIASNVEKTSRNISRFSKVSIIAGIISNLANGLIPALLH